MRFLVKVFLLSALAIETAGAADNLSVPDFSHYPQTEAFKFFIRGQTNANCSGWQLTNGLKIVSFFQNDRIGLMYSVDKQGHELDVRLVYDWAAQNSRSKQLSQDQIKNLFSATRDLPVTNVYPPIQQLVIVSFNDGTNWLTHSYDRSNLPPAMHKIYSIIGERSETRP